MANVTEALNAAAHGIAAGAQRAANYTARAAATANGVSQAAQTAQGNFNQGSVNTANSLGSDRLAEQYAFNSAQAAMANNFTEMMWDKSAAWNEMMWQRNADWNEMMWGKQSEFNAAEAQKNRDWQQMMRDTAYQAAVKDMEAAGLNPILAVTGGGIQTGAGGGGAASVGLPSMGAPSMSGAAGAMASGGLLNGLAASESAYSGQMEYMGGWLGLLSAAMDGLGTAMQVMGQDKNLNIIIKGLVDGMIPEQYQSKPYTGKSGWGSPEERGAGIYDFLFPGNRKNNPAFKN